MACRPSAYFPSWSVNTPGCVLVDFFVDSYYIPLTPSSSSFSVAPNSFYIYTLTFIVNLIIFNDWLITYKQNSSLENIHNIHNRVHGWKSNEYLSAVMCIFIAGEKYPASKPAFSFHFFSIAYTVRHAAQPAIRFYRWSKSTISCCSCLLVYRTWMRVVDMREQIHCSLCVCYCIYDYYP